MDRSDVRFGAYLKISRAERHLNDLERAITEFLARKPYAIVVNRDSPKERWIARVAERVPDEISLIIGDIAHNLISALDLLTTAIVQPTPAEMRYSQFPFSSGGAQELASSRSFQLIARKAPQVAKAILTLRPHGEPGGNPQFLNLRDLDRFDKHRLVIPTGAATRPQVTLVNNKGLNWDLSSLEFRPLEHETVILTTLPVDNLKHGDEVNASFTIEFAEGQPFERQPVLETVASFVQSIRDMVDFLARFT